MKYDDISKTMRAFIGGYEAFRKMGYSPDDLYCQTARSARNSGKLSAFVTLRSQGKEFCLECGPVNGTEDEFMKEFERVVAAVRSGEVSQEDLDRIWQESEPFHHKLDFALALTAKGFIPPRSLD